MDKEKLYKSLMDASRKLEELIIELRNTAVFWWYEGHLQTFVGDMRQHEAIGQWLEGRKQAGKLIDPITAEIRWNTFGNGLLATLDEVFDRVGGPQLLSVADTAAKISSDFTWVQS
jgi:hypothetical protein